MANAKDTLNPGLCAIALAIRSRDGPRFVFHYPPHPSTKPTERELRFGTELDTEPSEIEGRDQDDYDSDESELEESSYVDMPALGKLDLNEKMQKQQQLPKQRRHVATPDGDDHYNDKKGDHVVPWEHLFEFPTSDLESILTPSRAFHKKKFELSLDPLHFVAYPMHIREDGLWKKKKTKKSRKAPKETGDPGPDAELGDAKSKEKTEKPASNASEDGDDSGGMLMFTVAFILNLPKDEEDERIVEIYEHVIRKFNKALNHAQASNNYVWRESEMIIAMKEKAREERMFPCYP